MEMERVDTEFEYKVTVIIPIYDVEQYLEACLDSLLAQTIPPEEMEVLMINDGSPDGSLAICERYAEQYENFKVLSQENQGVSAARNNGIRNAGGKYLMYLDGDDTLSPGTAKNVTDFFDEHYDEVDVVTYPLAYRWESGNSSSHWRYKYLKKTGVYDLEKYPYICQTTMNICVKNKPNGIHFDLKLAMTEDQTYINDSLMDKGMIGFVKEGRYFYLQHENSSSKLYSHAYYASENTMCFLEHLAKKTQQFPKMKPYLGSIIIYNLLWRILGDSLYPYHFDQEQLAEYQSRLVAVVNSIDSETILHYPQMNIAHKFFLLSMRKNDNIFCRLERDHIKARDQIILRDKDGTFRQTTSIQIVLLKCSVTTGAFNVMGYLKEFAFSYLDKPTLFAVINGEERREVPLYLSQHSCFWSKIRTNTFWGFSFQIALEDFSRLKFVVDINGVEFPTNYWLSDRQPIQPKLHRSYLEGAEGAVMFAQNSFTMLGADDPRLQSKKKAFEHFLLREKPKQWLVRRYARKWGDKKIWLYEDTYNAIDNAYYQFQHDFGMDDGVKRYYICDKENIDWNNRFTAEQQRYVIQRLSKKHKRLFIQADKILTSFIGQNDFVPFDKNTIRYYWDLFRFEVIYLQHGVMHAELPNMYSKEKVFMVDKIVASTHFEKENMIGTLAFREEDVICSGMPRLDRLVASSKKRKILFAPSWRTYLLTRENGQWTTLNNYEDTDYFREVMAFLQDKALCQLLLENDYTLEIKLHPNFDVYQDAFEKAAGERMTVVTEANLGEYTACVTDFTSFMYDFLYLDIPVITHIFDRDRFKAGLHNYRELCWPMEKEYPYYCREITAVIAMLDKIIHNTGDFEQKFRAYTKRLYFSREPNHAEQLYRYLMQDNK